MSGSTGRVDLAFTIGFYMCASAGMSIFNKLAVVHLPLPVTIVAIQMAFTVATLVAKPSQLKYGSMTDVKRWAFTVPPLFVGMLASSMVAMQFASLGTIVVFRNIAPIPTMLIEGMFRIPFVISAETVGALLVIILGVMLYESHDIAFSRKGIAAIVLNMMFAVIERIMQRHLMANYPVDLSKPMMMLLNNGVGTLPCLLLAITWGEHTRWGEVFSSMDSTAAMYLIISCLNGLAISYAGLRLQSMVAATTFMVITNVNKFAVILFGIFAFAEASSPLSILGCFLAIAGGVGYGEARKRAESSGLKVMTPNEKSTEERSLLRKSFEEDEAAPAQDEGS